MELQKEIQSLREELATINKEKELYFKQKEELKKELKARIDELRKKRDFTNSSIAIVYFNYTPRNPNPSQVCWPSASPVG